MMGQGMGPIDDHHLRRYAATVLRRVDLIALREDRAGRPLLEQELGVDPAHITTTGDDAIELGFQPRASIDLGTNIGVNLRISEYSGVNRVDRRGDRRSDSTGCRAHVSEACSDPHLDRERGG